MEEVLSQSPISYEVFRTQLRREIWPKIPGEEANLVEARNGFFLQAMVEAARWVGSLQREQVSVWPFCSTLVSCAMTGVAAPPGRIKRVYSLANNEWCDRVPYRPVSEARLACWVRDLMVNFTPPRNCKLPALQQGWRYAESVTDIDYGRARVGMWARVGPRIHAAPWLQSNESLVVEWDGVRQTWGDDDIVDPEKWDVRVQTFLKTFVRWKDADYYGGDEKKTKRIKGDMEEALAAIIHDDQERTRQPESEECPRWERSPTAAELEDDVVPDIPDELIFAGIGDFGDSGPGTATEAVADLVKSWSPRFIVTFGDNQYTDPPDYDANVVAFYGDYINDSFGLNRFWPSIGNHDYSTDALQAYHTTFKALPGNKRYYDIMKGHVHFFIYNTHGSEVDGIAIGSVQALWLQLKMQLSLAQWKVVILHDPPYTEHVDYPGFSDLRLPFKDWGADIVCSGDAHLYQRYEVDGLPYIVNGSGGTPLFPGGSLEPEPNDVSPLRKSQYYEKHGAQRFTVSETSFKTEFITYDGEVIDTLTLTKETAA